MKIIKSTSVDTFNLATAYFIGLSVFLGMFFRYSSQKKQLLEAAFESFHGIGRRPKKLIIKKYNTKKNVRPKKT